MPRLSDKAELVCRGYLTFRSPTHFEVIEEGTEKRLSFDLAHYVFCHSADHCIAVYKRKPA